MAHQLPDGLRRESVVVLDEKPQYTWWALAQIGKEFIVCTREGVINILNEQLKISGAQNLECQCDAITIYNVLTPAGTPINCLVCGVFFPQDPGECKYGIRVTAGGSHQDLKVISNSTLLVP